MTVGVELFGVVAAATTLIEICVEIGNRMRDFKNRAKEADIFAMDLESQVEHLEACAKTVQRAARTRKQAGQEEQGEEEIAIWGTISRTLHSCQKYLEKFKEKLKEVATGKEDLNWIKKALLQRRIDGVEPQLLRLEKSIYLLFTTLNTSINIIHLY
jgi:hypothetical protein